MFFQAIPKRKRYALLPRKALHTFPGIALGNQQGSPRQNDPAFYRQPIECQSGPDMAKPGIRIGQARYGAGVRLAQGCANETRPSSLTLRMVSAVRTVSTFGVEVRSSMTKD
ncbi:MAG: hypothetical protein EOS56_04625 [Mesorhizobium sp.]|nr:MAG: hypothetical protein EOS29_15260 [Mesorhizobium sp.]RWC63090.1 MAG: hypothetical protein EOS56_04625 [Mesorhizobium sp.]